VGGVGGVGRVGVRGVPSRRKPKKVRRGKRSGIRALVPRSYSTMGTTFRRGSAREACTLAGPNLPVCLTRRVRHTRKVLYTHPSSALRKTRKRSVRSLVISIASNERIIGPMLPSPMGSC
jgi:hypothetical protein